MPLITPPGPMGERRLTPSYASFTTFWEFVQELSERGAAPQVLEDAVFGNRSKGSRFEVLSALHFFGLTDRQRRPTDAGRAFLENPTPEALRELVEKHYAPVIDLGLHTATAGQVEDVLRGMGVGEGSTLDKARRFFLNAAQKSGIEVGPHLKSSPGPSRGASQRRTRSKPSPKTGEPALGRKVGDLWQRYIEMLMEKAANQDTPNEDLLNRIEAALEKHGG